MIEFQTLLHPCGGCSNHNCKSSFNCDPGCDDDCNDCSSDQEGPLPKKNYKSNQDDGCFCRKCKEFHQWAEVDGEDGKFLCWRCAHPCG